MLDRISGLPVSFLHYFFFLTYKYHLRKVEIGERDSPKIQVRAARVMGFSSFWAKRCRSH